MIRLIPFLWLLLAALFPQTSQAHSLFQNPLRLEYTEKEVVARVYVSVKEICAAAGVPIGLEGNFEQAAVEEAALNHLPYLLKHLQCSIDGKPWQPELTQIKPPLAWDAAVTVADAEDGKTILEGSKRDRPDRILYQYHLRHACATAPTSLTLSHNMMADIPYAEGDPFKLSYSFIISPPDGSTPAIGLLPALQTVSFGTIYSPDPEAAQPQTAGQRFWHFLLQGLHHVLAGYDHLLFAAALVLGLRGFWPVVKVIGLFTLAHSITVTLAAYNLLKFIPSDFPKEPLIAGSIVVVALENVFFPRAKFGWRRGGLVFLFGLIHGLGFAEVFTESMMGLSSTTIALALVAFCVGVEIAHLCVVAPLSALMGWGEHRGGEIFQKRAAFWGSLLVALGGSYFLLAALNEKLHWLPPHLMPDALLGAK